MLKRTPILILLLAATSLAQSPSKVLKQAEKALGGTKALQARSSIVMSGRITRDRDIMSGHFLMETGRPNLYHIRYDINGEEFESGYNGRSGWIRSSKSGLQTLTGSESLIVQARAAFKNSLWLNAKTEKLKIAPGDNTGVNKHSTNNVVFTTPKGVSIKVYFDRLNGLPLREEIGNEVWECNDYRPVGSLVVPFYCTLRIDQEMYLIALDSVQIDQKVAASNFDFPRVTGEPLPDLTKLLADLRSNQDKIEQLLDTYSYTREIVSREADKSGKLIDGESETQQMSFYKGNRIERTIAKDGKPLTPSQQADEDKAVQKRVEAIDKRLAKDAENGKEDENTGQRAVSIAELLRASRLINPRRERFRGRDVIVFDFEPDPAFDFKNAKSMLKFFGKTAGVIWVDENDKQLVRVEAFLADDFSMGGGLLVKLKKGASFVGEQERVNDEIWLPSVMEINLSARVLMFKGIAVNQVIKSYDYRKFQTEVKDAKVNDVKKP